MRKTIKKGLAELAQGDKERILIEAAKTFIEKKNGDIKIKKQSNFNDSVLKGIQ